MKRLWLIFAQACTVLLAAGFVLLTLKPQWFERAAPAPATSAGELSLAARRAAPAVVAIDVEQQRGEPGAGMGSGVIVDGQGLVLTNHHVVQGARRIEVELQDGRRVEATRVGSDPETDLALLRIQLPGLPVARWGDSKALRVGDPVLAIGNPFGVGQTVTAGIVSALQRRQLGINVFENFIQTDAAINPGNSGGALVDREGRLVGIPSAIYSRSGGSLGVGFAIPAELAREVLQALQRDGRVIRGWIGVQTRSLTPELVQALKLGSSEGVLVSAVVAGAPAARAGVQAGDVLKAVAGQAVHSPEQLLERVAALAPDKPARLSLLRGSKALDVQVQVGVRPRADQPDQPDVED
ncbi:S1C family serine protease [Inhella proteolytica]|uniref:Trypsin-like peptidase domain-containing protein n=1 Tax=Inhella proteolytica TaxID=2795029 RepID=A0A931J114_9BURK|nr:trypsin-like peptidase domain-containing protein [Inhella proteolytica]